MKKGFTIVELLAINVIISVISLITYAVIQKNIDTTRRSSFKTSVVNMIEAAKEYVITNYEDNDFPVGGIDIEHSELDIKNSEFTHGVILKDEEGRIRVEGITDGRYCASGTKNDLVIEDAPCETNDDTPPNIEVKVLKNSATKIRFLVKMQDAQSGLKEFSYSYKGKKETVKLNEERGLVKEVVEISGLEARQEYSFVFSATNTLGDTSKNTNEISVKVTTIEVEEPIFKISVGSYATTKHVKIIYPDAKDYTYSYVIEGSEEVVLAPNYYEAEFDVNDNVVITAYVKKDGQEVVQSKMNISGLDHEAPTTKVYIEDKDSWTTSKKVYVKSEDKGSGVALRGYSIDNKQSWIKTDGEYLTTLNSNQRFTLKTRDKVGNIQEKFNLCRNRDFTDCTEMSFYDVYSIDNEAPKVEFKVIEGTLGTNNWYTSKTVKLRITITDQAKKLDENGNETVVDGGKGLSGDPTIEVTYENFSGNSAYKPYVHSTPTYKLVSSNGTTNVYDFVLEDIKAPKPCTGSKCNKKATIALDSNGTNSIKVDMVDSAGNSTAKQKKTGKYTLKKDTVVPTIALAKKKNKTIFTGDNTATKSLYTVTAGASSYTISCTPSILPTYAKTTATCTAKSGAGLTAQATNAFSYRYNATCNTGTKTVCDGCWHYKNTANSNDHSGDTTYCGSGDCVPGDYTCCGEHKVKVCSNCKCPSGGKVSSSSTCGATCTF